MDSFKWTIGHKWILFFWSNSPFGASWGAQLRKATKERDDGIKQVTHWSEAGIFTSKGRSGFSGFAESEKC